MNERKKKIDNMSYTSLLTLWRRGSSDNPYFRDWLGEYYAKVMAEKKAELSVAEQVRISKEIGW